MTRDEEAEARLVALEADVRDATPLMLSMLSRVDETARLAALSSRPDLLPGVPKEAVSRAVSLTTAQSLAEDVKRLLADAPESRLLRGSLAALERRAEEAAAALRELDPSSRVERLTEAIELFPRRK